MTIFIIGFGALGKSLAALLVDQSNIIMCERNIKKYNSLKKGSFVDFHFGYESIVRYYKIRI